jgi:hypothetical protein
MRRLTVSANIDASGYKAGADAKVAADRAMSASGRDVAASVQQTDQKISQAGDALARFSRRYVEGLAQQQAFQRSVAQVARQIETGTVSFQQMIPALDAAHRRHGLLANTVELEARGYATAAREIAAYNAQLIANAQAADRAAVSNTRLDAVNDNVMSGGANFRRANLGYQGFDVAQGLAAGTPFAIIAAQQGPQIAQLYAGAGGLNALLKDTVGLLGSVARAAGPWIAALAALYGAYRLLASYSAEAALAVDDATQALADQAAPLGSVRASLSELAGLQETYQKAITATGTASTASTSLIVANTRREFNAKKALIELEVRRQEALIKTQQAELAVAGLQMRRDIGQQVFTRSDLEAGGYADPRIGSVPFVRLPDDVSGLEKTQDVIENSPLFDRIKELRANMELTELAAEQLREAVKATFNDGSLIVAGGGKDNGIPIPQFRRIDDMPGDVEFYQDLERATQGRIRDLQAEQQALGLTGAAAEAFRFEQEALNAALAKNIELTPDQIDGIRKLAQAYGQAADAAARMKLGQDLAFEFDQFGRSPLDQQIASRLRGTGLGLDSPQADQMRQLDRMERVYQLGMDFWDEFESGIRNGEDIGEALGKAILQGLMDVLSDLGRQSMDMLLRTLIGSFMQGGGAATGGGAWASFGSIIGAIGSAANDNGASSGSSAGASLAGSVGAYTTAISSAASTVSTSMAAYRNAIASIESAGSGGYSAIGPTHSTLGRALGRYQIMEANVPSWSKAALGYSMTGDEFLANPSAQDAIFDYKFGQYVDKYGAEGAAQAWFGGEGSVGKLGRQDVLGTSVGEYSDKFNAALDKSSESVDSMTTQAQEASKSLGDLGKGVSDMGSGLSQFASQLSQAASGIGGGGGGIMSIFGSLLGMRAGIFGGSGAGGIGAAMWGGSRISGFAGGTESAPAGWAWVGEEGPELMRLRAGDVIRSHQRSTQMASATSAPGTMNITIKVDGARGNAEIQDAARRGAQAAINEYDRTRAPQTAVKAVQEYQQRVA